MVWSCIKEAIDAIIRKIDCLEVTGTAWEKGRSKKI